MTPRPPRDGPTAAADRSVVATTLAATVRHDRRAILASVMRACGGDFDLAEDAIADAVAEALPAWRARGIPHNPAGWLVVVARRRAVDRIRRATRRRTREERVAAMDTPDDRDDPGIRHVGGDGPVEDALSALGAIDADDQLRLVFTCCHPSLATTAQVALTLRYVAGLTTEQIASAFVVAPTTMAQRLVRARGKVRDAGIPFRVPADHDLPDRLAAVLAVVYLVFNEGYLAATDDHLQRPDVARDAIRLARLLHALMPDEAEVAGLLALVLLTHARAGARVDEAGALVRMADQDRSTWDRAAIDEGRALVRAALRRRDPGPYQVQAAIAACHADAATFADTDWGEIEALYAELVRMTGSPWAAVNGAVARAHNRGPAAGLRHLDDLLGRHDRLEAWSYYHVARGELAAMAGDGATAIASLERALAATTNPRERDHLQLRIRQVGHAGDHPGTRAGTAPDGQHPDAAH